MINKDVCKYISSNIDKHKKGQDYFADKLVKAGYGQTCGGYLINKDIMRDSAEPSQKEHFLNYYEQDEHKNKKPTYSQLYCPQLMLWIAEISELDTKCLQDAYNFIVGYENENDLKGKNKNASYMPKDIRTMFKDKLKIVEINNIIKDSNDWDQVVKEVKKL